MTLTPGSILPDDLSDYAHLVLAGLEGLEPEALSRRIEEWAAENRRIHEIDGINLNPATNVLNPRAEAMLSAGLGSRPSLGYPGDKYEMGLEAIEKIEIAASALACRVFGARFAELRVPSGSMANLYAFLATTGQRRRIIVPPAAIGGHVTHHYDGAAGLLWLDIHEAPVDPLRYTVDLDGLRAQARLLQPDVITIGGSLNLFPHPVGAIRKIADETGARVVFDAAHLSGLIAGGAWPNPLEQGAHIMTMSTYKSLAGPPAGMILTNDQSLAARLDRIAFPGLTANFDAGKTAALAITLVDWIAEGRAYAAAMVGAAKALADSLAGYGLPVFARAEGATDSHQLAIEAVGFHGGQAMAKRLRTANILASGIGLPLAATANGEMAGLRLGTPEVVRWGMGREEMPVIAGFIARAISAKEDPGQIGEAVAAFRRQFTRIGYIANATR